jgi:hypothetical protein
MQRSSRAVNIGMNARISTRSALAFLIPLFAVLLAGSTSIAQDDFGEGDAYREAIRVALEEYDAHSYAEAREQFLRAHSLYPNARTLRGLGFTEYELHNYVASVDYLEQALASRVRPLEGQTRLDTDALLKRAQGYLGTVQLRYKPRTTVVTLDGEPLERPDASLHLTVGDHVLVFHAPGYIGQRRAITVRGGETKTLEVALVADPAVARGNNGLPAEREPHARPLYKQWWLWTAVGVVAAGVVVGALYATRGVVERPATTPNTPVDGTISTRMD